VQGKTDYVGNSMMLFSKSLRKYSNPSLVSNFIILTSHDAVGKTLCSMLSIFSKEYVDILPSIVDVLSQSFRCWALKKSHPQNTAAIVHLISHRLRTRAAARNHCWLLVMLIVQMLHPSP